MKRREFIVGSSAFLFQAATIKKDLIIRSESPADFETPVQLLDKGWITSNVDHYVRSHLPLPNVQLNDWKLAVEGAVNESLNLTMPDIRAFTELTRTVTLECSGNGRAFADPPVPGLQWEKGAVGTARWTGIRLRDVLMKAQVKPAAKHVILNGADLPIRAVPDFVRSIRIEKAMDPDTMLAYRMNGDTIPIYHGFPLRLIVPGWEAAASTKWITNIRASEAAASGSFMQTAYRIPNPPVAPASTVAPKDTAPYTAL